METKCAPLLSGVLAAHAVAEEANEAHLGQTAAAKAREACKLLLLRTAMIAFLPSRKSGAGHELDDEKRS